MHILTYTCVGKYVQLTDTMLSRHIDSGIQKIACIGEHIANEFAHSSDTIRSEPTLNQHPGWETHYPALTLCCKKAEIPHRKKKNENYK